MKNKITQNPQGPIFTFENGVKLTALPSGNGHVETPARADVGTMGFPVRHVGDVLHSFRMNGATVANIPAACRAW